MRKIALCLLALPLLAVAEEFSDKAAGLVIDMPDGWERDSKRERGGSRFAAKLDLAPQKYVLVEISMLEGRVNVDKWVAYWKGKSAEDFKSVDTPFAVSKDFTVGGESATLLTVGGTRVEGGTEYSLRRRLAGIQNGNVFLSVQELSFNGAHKGQDAAIKAMWEAIQLQAPESGGEDGDEESDDSGAPTEPVKVEDKTGNYSLTLPAGWVVEHAPPDEANAGLRLLARRLNGEGDQIGFIRVIRFTSGRAETFSLETASDYLVGTLDKGDKWFERYYGERTAGTIRPEIDEGVQLGGADKSMEFEYRGIRAEEEEKIREAEKLRARGDKTAVIPEFKEIVVRGRLALISPNIYFVEVAYNRAFADDEKLVEEYKAIMESWAFASTEALPAPIAMVPFNDAVGGRRTGISSKRLGDTTASHPTKRKTDAAITLTGRKPYTMEATLELPPGFIKIEEQIPVANLLFIVVAQDDRNNWVRVVVQCLSHRQAGDKGGQLRDKNETYASWASNFESLARGAKIPRKPQSVKLGLSGKGYKKLSGSIEGHRATLSACINDKGGWQTVITVETRGEGDRVFAKQLKTFLRKMKLKAKK